MPVQVCGLFPLEKPVNQEKYWTVCSLKFESELVISRAVQAAGRAKLVGMLFIPSKLIFLSS